MKPRWACSECGMWSSRRWNVQRHIEQQHFGRSRIVGFTDYIAGATLRIHKGPVDSKTDQGDESKEEEVPKFEMPKVDMNKINKMVADGYNRRYAQIIVDCLTPQKGDNQISNMLKITSAFLKPADFRNLFALGVIAYISSIPVGDEKEIPVGDEKERKDSLFARIDSEIKNIDGLIASIGYPIKRIDSINFIKSV